MADPYFLVAYGHTIRVSERCYTQDTAMQYCFGLIETQRMTCSKQVGKSWCYVSQKEKRRIIVALAQAHYDRTGSVLSGCEKEITKQKEKAHDSTESARNARKRANAEHESAGGQSNPDNDRWSESADQPAGYDPHDTL